MKLPWSKKPPAATATTQEPLFRTHNDTIFPRTSKNVSAALDRSFQRTHSQLKTMGIAMDASVETALKQTQAVMDNSIQQVKGLASANQGIIPQHLIEYFANQGFIGWQMCAVLAQNWLINKACKMPAQDAIRHGFERSVNDGVEIDPSVFDDLRELDKEYKLKNNLIEFYRFARVFGIRHMLFIVDGIDYEAPFNPDGVREGSYRGMTQIDPYWIAPMFNTEDAADPYSQNFYNPTWWMLGSKKIHRSHFVISRNGNDLADLLKPSYFYGGIPTPQLIYDRIYAAERTANEAPLLAMTKRLITLTTDTTQAMANLGAFQQKLSDWMQLINNFGVKILGQDEKVEQIDTNLSGLDETIMTQYQLVAAIAEVPATKLLGTSPKGFGASGDYENDSYHEFLESIQENELSPIIERHTLLCQRSHGINPDVNMEVQWLPVDTPSAKEMAEINQIKAQADSALVDAGAIDGSDVRRRLINDRDSGYNGIEEEMEHPDAGQLEGEPEGGGEEDDEEEEDLD